VHRPCTGRDFKKVVPFEVVDRRGVTWYLRCASGDFKEVVPKLNWLIEKTSNASHLAKRAKRKTKKETGGKIGQGRGRDEGETSKRGGREREAGRENLPPLQKKKEKEREKEEGKKEEEREGKKTTDERGYSWKEDPPGDDTGPRASIRASEFASSLARSASVLPACVH
jgi:hypothetical protein